MRAMAAGIADGILALFWASATLWMQWTDGMLAAFIVLIEVFPFVVDLLGLRQKQDASRWVVAIERIDVAVDLLARGCQRARAALYALDLFRFHQQRRFSISKESLSTLRRSSRCVLFAAILYAVYRYALEQQARHSVMEREIQSAREIQQVLVPEALPAIEGYAVTSAYQPALEVGGDFFQIIPNPDGSTMVALGDVSGKGLKAGMNVSMIVGVLRAEAESTSPAVVLGALNRCLAGRMAGGFATGMVFRVDQDGTVTFANAGHLPPYLNGQEYPLDASSSAGADSLLRLHGDRRCSCSRATN